MKIRRFFLCVVIAVAIVASVSAQEVTHTTTATNTIASRSTIDVAGLAGNPNAIIIATPTGNTATLNAHPIGAWYYNGKWNIFNVDHVNIPPGATYKLQIFLGPGPNQFLHVISQAEAGQGYTFIDNPVLNGNGTAKVEILQNHAPGYRSASLNQNAVKIQYDSGVGKWYIQNLNLTALNANTAYNVVVVSGGVRGTGTTITKPIETATLPPRPPPSEPPPPVTAGGDLRGTYPDPKVVGLQGRPVVFYPEPKTGDVLRWNGSEWAASKETAPPPPAARPSVLSFDQTTFLSMNDQYTNSVTLPGLNQRSFTLAQNSRIVFHTTVYAKISTAASPLGNPFGYDVWITTEILNASNTVVARATCDMPLFQGKFHNLNSVGIGVLPAGTYRTRVTINRPPGGSVVDTHPSFQGALAQDKQGGQMIIEIFPD